MASKVPGRVHAFPEISTWRWIGAFNPEMCVITFKIIIRLPYLSVGFSFRVIFLAMSVKKISSERSLLLSDFTSLLALLSFIRENRAYVRFSLTPVSQNYKAFAATLHREILFGNFYTDKESKMVDFSLRDKTALITGASRGIGEAIAMTLAEQGAHCILVSRKIEELQGVVNRIVEAGGSAEAIACHMGHLDQIESLFQKIEEKQLGLDILVNNAATNPFFGGMIDVTEAAWDKTLDVNLKGPFFMVKQAALLMAKKGGGAVVNVASITGVSPAPFQGVYSISKAAMISMTKAYAKELASFNIRVNALLPGLTKTKFSSALIDNDEIYKIALKDIPMNRHAEPKEMAGAVLYLVSDAASFTTGTCIVCDGGNLI